MCLRPAPRLLDTCIRFFLDEPRRFRRGPVFCSARGPRSLCVGRNLQAHADAQNTDALFDATAGYGWDCSFITLSGRWGGDISAEAGLSVVNDYSLEREDECIPASIADIVDDTVGAIAGVVAVLFGLSAEATPTVQVHCLF